MKNELRHAFSRVFKEAAQAFGSIDYTGTGFITIKDILKHNLMKKLSDKYTDDDIRAWLYRDNIFERKEGAKIDFAKF